MNRLLKSLCRSGKGFVLALLILAPLAAGATVHLVLPGTNTIADAIADPGTLDGDTLRLAPGLYSPAARINVTKQLHILGPKANVDPRPSYGSSRNENDTATEAILDGGGVLPIIMRFLASEIELKGVVVRNGTGDLVDAPNEAPVKLGLSVRACIIHHSSGDEGVQLRNCDNSHIEYNYVHDTRGDAINFAFSNDCFIEHNECYNIASDDAAIYVYNDGQRGRINCTIRCNLVELVTYNDGIKLGAKQTGADAALAGGTVECNVIRTTNQDAISIYSGEVVVRNNEITGSTSENGALYVSFNVNGTQIHNNYIHDNGSTGDTRTTYGIRIAKESCSPTNTVLSDNRLMNNEAQTWDQGTGSSWNANCYSDWVANPYAIGGPGGYLDNNGSLDNCSVIPCQCTPPQAVLYLTIIVEEDSVRLRWPATAGSVSYKVYGWSPFEGTPVFLQATTDTTCLIPVSSARQFFHVIATDQTP